MFISKSQVIQAVKSNQVLILGLFLVSVNGLYDQMSGQVFNISGIEHFATQLLRISLSFSIACIIIVLITLIFRHIQLKRTKEA